jgi:hypothetical protein
MNVETEITVAVQLSVGSFCRTEVSTWERFLCKFNRLLFSLICQGFLEDSISYEFICIPPERSWNLVVEVPDFADHITSVKDHNFVYLFPLLEILGQVEYCDHFPLQLDDDAVHVAKYLKAFNNGTIDFLCSRSHEKKDVMLV